MGRGVDDNKGPAVAAMYVIRCLHELGVSLTHPLCLFVGCDEEVGMRDLEYYTKNHPCPRLSIVSDCGFPVCYAEKGIIEANLISEPLSDEILSLSGGLASNIVPDRAEIRLKKSERVINQLSMLPHELKYDEQADEVRITAHGVAAHTAFPEGGVNAIAQLAKGLVYANLLNDEDAGVLQFFCEATQDFMAVAFASCRRMTFPANSPALEASALWTTSIGHGCTLTSAIRSKRIQTRL